MKTRLVALLLLGVSSSALLAQAQSTNAPLRIFLRGGTKDHGPAGNGLHDHEVWLQEWLPLLTARGARVDGSQRTPTAEQLENTDVVVMFAANPGNLTGEQRASFEKFLKRGGGIVCFHDAVLAGGNPQTVQWWKTIIGGAWDGSDARYYEARPGEELSYYFTNREHPITKGVVNFKIEDEIYWQLHMMPEVNVLAVAMQPPGRGASATTNAVGNVIPQIWVYQNQLEDGQPYRAFVSILGHHFSTLQTPHVRAIELRGIAWAARRDPNLLLNEEELATLRPR